MRVLLLAVALPLLSSCQQGPAGPAGERGERGLQGTPGTRGDKGEPGAAVKVPHLIGPAGEDLGVYLTGNCALDENQREICLGGSDRIDFDTMGCIGQPYGTGTGIRKTQLIAGEKTYFRQSGPAVMVGNPMNSYALNGKCVDAQTFRNPVFPLEDTGMPIVVLDPSTLSIALR